MPFPWLSNDYQKMKSDLVYQILTTSGKVRQFWFVSFLSLLLRSLMLFSHPADLTIKDLEKTVTVTTYVNGCWVVLYF